MTRDPYDIFAAFYDSWQAGFTKPFSEAILPFYEDEIRRNGVPDRSLADIACGTGIFLSAWHRRSPGWRLLGTDGSSGMLRAARRKSVPARLLLAKMEETRLPAAVGAAVSVFDSVNHITQIRRLRRAFRSIAASVLPGGLFLFDLNDERAFARLFSGSWTIESEGFFASVTATQSGGIGTSRFVIFSNGMGRAWRRTNILIRERNWRGEEIRRALAEAGFTVLRVRSIRPYPAYEVDSPRTLWICRRPLPRSK